LNGEEQQAIATVPDRRGSNPARKEQDAAAVAFAVRHLFEREAVVPEKKLLAEALKHGLGAVTVEGVQQAFAGQPLFVEEREGRRLSRFALVGMLGRITRDR
jgi:hypothetical protein